MTASEIVRELASLQTDEAKIHKRRDELLQMLSSLPEEEWDWIPISEAARMIGRSAGFVYKLVNKGKLETKHIGSCVNVRKSELLAYDDKYESA